MKNSNVVFVNGAPYTLKAPKKLLADILASIPDLNYWSYAALRELYEGLVGMVCELCQAMQKGGVKKAAFTRFLSQAPIQLKFIPIDRDDMLAKIFGIILAEEGMGLLRGFGVTNRFGDKLPADPEKQSLRKVGNGRVL